MKLGVVYQFKTHHKINGTLFYCFEYFQFLKKFSDVKFYIVGISDTDLALVNRILLAKYKTHVTDIVPIKLVELYALDLDRTLVLDVRTFYGCKEFMSNEVHCFSNETHEMFRYKNDRTVTYYGSYDYQRYDVFCYLKLNFEIFKLLSKCKSGVFISSPNEQYIKDNMRFLSDRFKRPLILKSAQSGIGNLFELIDAVHYVHTSQDTNNRIIPEAFFFDKQITIDFLHDEIDSISLRYDDIMKNGLANYTLTADDEMIKAMLR
jgi:hypothetical protein